ncbi:cytochrome c oxidase assembly protein [Streptomyces sp. NPDC059740]|uniref:cytochrome c oxidase assembly protein n=1 Tax=Streptomyces sp. NPDC059740 TaxID=3346926 RepID=UPI003659E0B5
MTGHGTHPGHAGTGGGLLPVLLPALVLLACSGLHLYLVGRARHRNPEPVRSRWRAVSLTAGLALLAVALLPPLAPFAHRDFRGHMAQHLLVGMYAPLALVLGAPVTLLLRNLRPGHGRRLTAVLHSRPVRVVAHPLSALLLATGSLVPLYFTPLYDSLTAHPAGHWLLHVHFLLSGCLFAYVVAGPDPAPGRPGVPARLWLLGCAIAVHAVVSQLMYGGFFTHVHAPVAQVRGGAELMYYGGDIAELLLAAALVTTWRPERRPRPVAAAA